MLHVFVLLRVASGIITRQNKMGGTLEDFLHPGNNPVYQSTIKFDLYILHSERVKRD